jgi:predicted MFS family arabinose efflux permease
VRADRWYRHYLIVQMLFGSVVFGSSFYSIRVAAIGGYDHDDVVIFVIVVCVGLLVGIPLWSRVRTRFGLIGLFVGGAMLSVAAAALAIAFQVANVWPNVVVISATLALTSVANQSVFAAGQLWISHFAGPRLRVVLISFGQVVISAGLIMLSLPLGVVAGRTEALWPVTVVLLLNVIAAYSARRLAPHDH